MKRIVDFLLAALLLLVLSPVMLLVALAVAATLGWPVFFLQQRPGLHGRPFRLIKFRTMSDALDRQGCPLPDAARLGRFGRALRASSLDELPELLNVLKGDMSLVGPRPLLAEYLPLYDERQRRRHEVRPGMTGWAQVNGRNSLDWAERLELDAWYVENRSLSLDCRILMMTILEVLRARGISEKGQATMTKFRGNRSDDAARQGRPP